MVIGAINDNMTEMAGYMPNFDYVRYLRSLYTC